MLLVLSGSIPRRIPGIVVVSGARPLSWSPGRLLPTVAVEGLLAYPARLYRPPLGLWTGPARVLLPAFGSLSMHPRTALVVDGLCLTLVQGAVTLQTGRRRMLVRLVRRGGFHLEGRATLLVAHERGTREPLVLLHSGRIDGALGSWPGPSALRCDATGLQRVPWPRSPVPPAERRRPLAARHLDWLARDLANLAGLRAAGRGWTRDRHDLEEALQRFSRDEQRILGRLLASRDGLPFDTRVRVQAWALERGCSALRVRSVQGLTVADSLALADHLRALVAGPPSALRRACTHALARAGDLAALAAGEDRTPDVARFTGPAEILPGLQLGGTEAGTTGSGLLARLQAWLAGRKQPLRTFVARVLDDPGSPEHRLLLEGWAAAGVCRLHLERFLQEERLPRGLLDLRSVARGAHPGVTSRALSLLASSARTLLARRRRLEARTVRALERGTLSDAELALAARLVGGRRLLEVLEERLRSAGEQERAGLLRALVQLLGRPAAADLCDRLGPDRAWSLTLEALRPTWIAAGEGLVWGEPDR